MTMDALAGLLDGPRAQGAFLLKAVLSAPWSLRIADEAPLAVFTVLDGDAWLVHPGLDGPVELGGGRHRRHQRARPLSGRGPPGPGTEPVRRPGR